MQRLSSCGSESLSTQGISPDPVHRHTAEGEVHFCRRPIGFGGHPRTGQLHGPEARLSAARDILRERVENASGALRHDEAPYAGSAGAQERLSATEAIKSLSDKKY